MASTAVLLLTHLNNENFAGLEKQRTYGFSTHSLVWSLLPLSSTQEKGLRISFVLNRRVWLALLTDPECICSGAAGNQIDAWLRSGPSGCGDVEEFRQSCINNHCLIAVADNCGFNLNETSSNPANCLGVNRDQFTDYILAQEIADLEKDTGFKLRILAQNHPDTPAAKYLEL
ncbi:hypothetical protein MRB53_032183 [Persea americana]|uniref:Uncharacterized protein n=2 Tax=Persea americana TaxID=3435 RepID=A0ACC2KRD6_PERAE|nr:hypothetical protein MRB53_032173 [Persea americana]KAJ8623653.1 hypothetical protein MRB53_032183 [Persea americana]